MSADESMTRKSYKLSAAEELQKRLPPAPARVLMLGDGGDTFLQQLHAQGYQVVAPSFCQSKNYAQTPTETRRGIYQVDLDLAPEVAASFDAAIVWDFSPDVHPLALFDQLTVWLAQDAVVHLAGARVLDLPPIMQQWLKYVVAIGARCGFVEQVLDEDTSAADADYLFRSFRKGTALRWQLRHVRPNDFQEIATLFHEVFGHTLSQELWTWKYGQGRGNSVIAARSGRLIAHYGGMYRDVLLFGRPDWVVQIGDVMVHPQERGVMTRQGPFFLTAATFAELYLPLGYGFPNSRAMAVAKKMGLYSEVGQMTEVRWAPASSRTRLRTRVKHLKPGDAANRMQIDDLWASMAQDLRLSVACIRDGPYLDWRYFSHPHNHYEVMLVTARITGRPLGVVVLRRMESSCELMDVIGPLTNLPLLIDQARRLTGLWGLPYLYCWITKNHAQRFLDCDGQEEPLSVSIPASCWIDDPRGVSVKDKWWLMSGDTDFR